MEIYLSEIDQTRFGRIVAKAKISEPDDVGELIAKARDMGAELLIVRLPTTDLKSAQSLERRSAILTDTLVYFQKKKIDKYNVQLPDGYTACAAQSTDAESVGCMAAESFKGYFGHYHADDRLNKSDCDDVYTSWAKNSCLKGTLADEVLLIKKHDEIAAFATVKKIGESSFEGVLFGVGLKHQGKGLHLNLMQLSQNWGFDNNMRRMLTSTQITNVTVQKNWCRVGMEPVNSFYTFHIWLNHDSI